MDFLGGTIDYVSGSFISEFPKDNFLFFLDLKKEFEIIYNYKAFFPAKDYRRAVFGLFENFGVVGNGKISVFGDSSCFEKNENDCNFVLDYIFDFFEGKKEKIQKFKILENYKVNYFTNNSGDYFLDFFRTIDKMNYNFVNCQKKFFSNNNEMVNYLKIKKHITKNLEIKNRNYYFIIIILIIIFFVIIRTFYKRRKRRIGELSRRQNLPEYTVIYI